MKRLLLLLAMMLVPCSLLAAEKKLEFVGKVKTVNENVAIDAKVHDLVEFSAKVPVGAKMVVFAYPEIKFIQDAASPRIAFFANAEGRYLFFVAAFVGDDVYKGTCVVTVGDNPNPPNPPNPPDPVVPTSAVGKGIYDAFAAIMGKTDRLMAATKSASAVQGVRAKVAATTMTDIQVATSLLVAIKDAVGETSWKQLQVPIVTHLAKPLADQLKAAGTDKSKQLKVVDDMVSGLKAVR